MLPGAAALAATAATWASTTDHRSPRHPAARSAQRLGCGVAGRTVHPYRRQRPRSARQCRHRQPSNRPKPVAARLTTSRRAAESRRFPTTLRGATARFADSNAARDLFGDTFVEHYVTSRDWETREAERTVTDWQLARYFEII